MQQRPPTSKKRQSRGHGEIGNPPTTLKLTVPHTTFIHIPQPPDMSPDRLDSSSRGHICVSTGFPTHGADMHQAERPAYRPTLYSAAASDPPVNHSRPRTPTQVTELAASSPPRALGPRIDKLGCQPTPSSNTVTICNHKVLPAGANHTQCYTTRPSRQSARHNTETVDPALAEQLTAPDLTRLPVFPSCPGPHAKSADELLTRPTPSAGFRQLSPVLASVYTRVCKLGVPNYRGARIPLQSKLNIQAWRKHEHKFKDKSLVDLLQYGFPAGYDSDIPPVTGLKFSQSKAGSGLYQHRASSPCIDRSL